MGNPSEQQDEIVNRMKAGWNLERVYGEFPFTHVLVPPSGRGGIHFQNSPVKALSDRGIIRMGESGKIELVP